MARSPWTSSTAPCGLPPLATPPTSPTQEQALDRLFIGNVDDNLDIAVEGHTDNVPLRGQIVWDNWDLSAKRATSVMRILIAGGVSPKRLHAVGRADTAPVADNATAEGRARNRRTEIVLSPKVDKILEAL